MRAYREADINGGTSIMTAEQFAALPAAQRSSNVLYLVGTVASGDITISQVWVGNTPQQFLVDNLGALVWVGTSMVAGTDTAISGFTNAAVPVVNLV